MKERNKSNYQYYDCPLYGGYVTYLDCFDMHLIADRFLKEDCLPKEIREIPNFRDICLACKHHMQD